MSEEQREKFLNAASKALGMSTDDLKAELDSGKRLNDIAKEKGVSEKDLHGAINQALGRPEGAGHHGPRAGHNKEKLAQQVLSGVAEKLGVSMDTLSSVKSGSDLRAVAAKAGVSDDQLAGILEDAFSKLMPYGPNGSQGGGDWGGAAARVDEVA